MEDVSIIFILTGNNISTPNNKFCVGASKGREQTLHGEEAQSYYIGELFLGFSKLTLIHVQQVDTIRVKRGTLMSVVSAPCCMAGVIDSSYS